jgi:hypothetical protein
LDKQTDKELMMRRSLPDLRPTEQIKNIDSNQNLSQEEIDYKNKISLIKRKIKHMKYKELRKTKMSSEEMIQRKSIRSMTKMYKDDCTCYPVLKDMIYWDPKLVDRFLADRPTFDEMNEVLWYYPLDRHSINRANKVRGYILDPEDFGYKLKLDPSHDQHEPDKKYYIPHPKKPWTWKLNTDPYKIGEYEKLVIEEAGARMEIMEFVIQKHKENSLKISYVIKS